MNTEPGLFAEPARVPVSNQHGRRRTSDSARTPAGPHSAPTGSTNDLSLIEAVLAVALEVGYVLSDDLDQVWRRQAAKSGDVDPVTADDATAVRQLLREGLLVRGGARQVTRDRSEVSAVAVVVPDRTRLMARRWASLHKPAGVAGTGVAS